MAEYPRDTMVSVKVDGAVKIGSVVCHGQIKVQGREPIPYTKVSIGGVVKAFDPDELFLESI